MMSYVDVHVEEVKIKKKKKRKKRLAARGFTILLMTAATSFSNWITSFVVLITHYD